MKRSATRSVRPRPARLHVESLERRQLLATFTVANTDDSGLGSLRQAILDANGASGADTIAFDIPGSGTRTIRPTSALPDVTDTVTIDGYTQPGASPNTLADGDDAVLLIQLSGTLLPGGDGLHLLAGGSTVRGLAINGFAGRGILSTGGGNTIRGNFIGTDVTGTHALGNGTGIEVSPGPARTTLDTIGGTTPAARNVISGNQREGILGLGDPDVTITKGNVIQGNFIGTDATGTKALPNGGAGIFLANMRSAAGAGSLIGGGTAGARNVISGNGSSGVSLAAADGNVVQGNLIGTDVTGSRALGNSQEGVAVVGFDNLIGGTSVVEGNVISGNGTSGVAITIHSSRNKVQGNTLGLALDATSPLGNGSFGVRIDTLSSAAGNLIGGISAGAGNRIAFNRGSGVDITIRLPPSPPPPPPDFRLPDEPSRLANGNSILSNAIYSNASGITFNGALLPNFFNGAALQPDDAPNFPILSSVSSDATGTRIAGTLDNAPNTTFLLQFFANSTTDPSGYGQGRILIGATSVTTDASGHASFVADIPRPLAPGQTLTATATGPDGDTSGFSPNTTDTADLTVNSIAIPPTIALGNTLALVFNVGNRGPATATGVTFEDVLPASFAFVSATATQGTVTASGGTVTADLGSLGAGAIATITIIVRPSQTGRFFETASVQGQTLDPVANNVTFQEASVIPQPQGPSVVSLATVPGRRGQPAHITLTFNAKLDPARAWDTTNYTIVDPGRDGRFGTRDDKLIRVISAVYDAAAMTVALRPGRALSPRKFFQLIVNGKPPRGLTSPSGTYLNGGDYRAVFRGFGRAGRR